ncbi:hypothetical protein HGRIS_014575 [Hohenbuehelia grisea]|uniref:Lectin n=1 Tax=Hohenbuehelia grisea TaxID=104357 RepID=A0ABR3JU15_9AGAR
MRFHLSYVALVLQAAQFTGAAPAEDFSEKHPLRTLTPLGSVGNCKVTAKPRQAVPVDLETTPWIWTGEKADAGAATDGAFRKSFDTPKGKCALFASILVGSDTSHTLFVNGKEIGRGAGFRRTSIYYVALQPERNTFAIQSHGNGPRSGVASSVLVQYSDGSSYKIVTDNTWRQSAAAQPPTDWQLPEFDDNSWKASQSLGIRSKGGAALPPMLEQHKASRWVWTDNDKMPSLLFRKTIQTPQGKRPVAAIVLMNVYGNYTFWANGAHVYTDENRDMSEAYFIPNVNDATNIFAVKASTNTAHPGFIATILLAYADGSNDVFHSGTTWKVSDGEHKDFENPGFDDSKWSAAVDKGAFGQHKWWSASLPDA